MSRLCDFVVLCVCVLFGGFCLGQNNDVKEWLKDVDANVTRLASQMTSDEWSFFTHVNDINRQATSKSRKAFWNYVRRVTQEASSKGSGQSDSTVSGQLALWKAMRVNGSEQRRSLELNLLQQFSEITDQWHRKSGTSRDFDVMLDQWTALHNDITRREIRDVYEQYVKLPSTSVGQNADDLDDLMSPLVMTSYRQLHAYVREELRKSFGPHRMPATRHIPAHLIDGEDGVDWHRVFHLLLPYKFASHSLLSSKVTNVDGMLRQVEEFFKSLGYEQLPASFWQNSVVTRSADNTTQVCFPSRAWSLLQNDDYRMTGCLEVSHGGLRRAVEVMANVMALREASTQPYVLEQHDLDDYVTPAISGALSLAYSTPAHLRTIGLLPMAANNQQENMENEINFLMEVALDRLSPLGWYHVISEWQTTIMKQESPEKWNSKWWQLRCSKEGVSAPVNRTDEDFDAGASSAVLLNVPGKTLFQSAVAQFQILKSLCQTAGFAGPLSTCNIRNSKAVGNKIRNVLHQGRLTSPEQKLQVLTGTNELNVTAMLDYLQPLSAWLADHLENTNTQWAAACPDPESGKVRDPDTVAEFLDRYNNESQDIYVHDGFLAWNYETNITGYNSELQVNYSLISSQFSKDYARRAAMFDRDHIDNATQRRMLKSIGDIGPDALTDESKVKRLSEVLAEMAQIYSTAQVCFTEDNCVPLDPDLTRLMANDRNYTKLSTAWRLWRDATGPKLKDLYEEFVQIGNEGVQELGFADMGESWRDAYEDDNFREELEALLEELRPMYQQLHTYVRKRLMDLYGEDKFPSSGHIPAHILGNMWAQQWNNIYDLVVPFPHKESVDVTEEMVKQNWTVERMFHTSEEFYTSLGLSGMPDSFWKGSMIRRPADGREVVCHASAWDFLNGKDFRIKMCTVITMEDLITIHHEMGHIQYYLQYKDQPLLFKGGANPGFHEAIGDTMALSVATPTHLQKIHLLSNVENDEEADLNFLLKMALEKIAFLPFGYLIDQWRWSVFSGDTPPDHYNDKWWQLRCKYQGVAPPVDRTSDDFDPGAKFHVPDNTPYIRYFVSFVMQFTFYKRLCEAANHTGPLHRCDFYQSKEAGAIFGDMLRKGASEPWQDILQSFNGQRIMDASAIIDYFRPLTDWLAKNNSGLPIGWTDQCPLGTTQKIKDETSAREWLDQYNDEAKDVMSRSSFLAWNYATNITDYNQQAQVNGDLVVAQWAQKKAAEVGRYDWQHFADDSLLRQFRSAADIGTAAMKNQTKLKQLGELQSTIEGIYAKAKVRDPDSGEELALEPELTRLLASSRDYDKLLWVWKSWRDVTGPLMKDDYERFAALSNEAVHTLGYADTGEYWRSVYESSTFQADLEVLLEQLSPLYNHLHAFVRRKLVDLYGASKFPYSGHIPAHLLGNMWGQSWGNLYDFLQPFPNKSAIDVTPELLRQGYTVERMFTTAEEFFLSLGLEPMPLSFYKDSMMERPTDGRDVVCHASAWDFSNGQDFRIKMCTDKTMDDLITIHHEMGHIQYYLQYKNQPFLFQTGANPGFHEAIGDTLALSVSTPIHLKTIQLLPEVEQDLEADLNYLLKMALEKIAFLPFGYLIDQWRWSVFSGDTLPDHYNDKWWQLRCKYQGISSPVPRNSTDFDPGAKYHVPSNTPYIRYFVAGVVQFQFYKALCDAAGHQGALHTCDFYRSKEAGQLLSNMLRLGASKPWPEALQQMTGTRHMNATPIIEYFQPLLDWLETQNAGHPIGWTEECPQQELMTAAQWLQDYDLNLQEKRVESTFDDWDYTSNITDENSVKSVQGRVQLATFQKEEAQKAEEMNWRNLSDASLRRQFQILTNIGPSAMRDPRKFEQMQTLQTQMEGIYGAGKVCLDSTTTCLGLEPDLEDILAESHDYDRLLAVWKGWRDVTGPKMKSMYQDFVALSNEGVKEIGYADTGEYWRSFYESETFQEDLEMLLEQLSPLYEQLHAYVRRKLINVYGEENFPETGHIPAHLFGNMWSQEWNNIYNLLQPYPNRTAMDVTAAMRSQKYTVEKMFRTAEEFFMSLGFEPMPDAFWSGSIVEKPTDRDMVCHASAWDFYNGKDFRIKMCTYVTQEDLVTIHHEMGHIQYYLQYRQKPQVFRDGANPGFHEAVGDTIALSVSTPAHLRKIGLLEEGEDNYLDEINFLLNMALEKVAFLPFGYLIDQWRWSVFCGDTPPDHYNDKWWQLRCRYQGVSPPIPRSGQDFDPGAKYHIPGNTPYIRYFAARVLQFQFQQALCRAAGHTGPLHACDIYKSDAAGQMLRSMLSKGSSTPWPDVLEEMTGFRRMDAGALLEYFRPLQQWLESQNAQERLGWTRQCPDDDQLRRSTDKPSVNSTQSPREKEALRRATQWLQRYNLELEKERVNSTFADWAYASNITDENSVKSVDGRVRLATFQKEEAQKAEELNWQNLSDVTIRRQFKVLTNIGPSAMRDPEKFKRLQTLQTQMEGIYGAGKVCLDSTTTCLGLEPDLEDILVESHDYDRLLAVWKGWRDVTGPKMKSMYQDFVALSNEGVREIGYADTGEYWRSFYESETFQEDLEMLLEQLSPLYEQLHAYVRHKLINVYGEENFPETGHIPAHLFGNMWSQEWNNIYNLLQPYPNRTAMDVTTAMNNQNYTVRRMFRTAESFFKSLGFEAMPDTFWSGSIVEKPTDRDMVCHASAWDFYNGKDFRIKMCTYVTQEDLVTIHHEMGHIQYFLQYRRQPQVFRDGANPGFHEAVGDTIALSVSTPAHLRKIGLLEEGEDNYLDEINFLLKMALEKVAFLPFGYLIDQWRWSVFSGDTSPDHYNDKWWQLRCRYQGVSPPIPRSGQDFDPGAKYHIPGNTPYIRYFASFVLQFQFQQALCRAAGHTGPLHSCDIYNSGPAGRLLRSMLSKGSSTPWPDVLEEMTGFRRMDAGALLEYFRPLQQWLESQNVRERLGWTRQCPDDDQLRRTPRSQSNNEHSTEASNSNNSNSATGVLGDRGFCFIVLLCLAFVVNTDMYL